MALTSTLQFQNYVLVNGNRNGPYNETLTGALVNAPNFTVSAGTTVTLDGTAFTTAKLLGFSLYSANAAVTVKFNTTGSSVNYSLTAAAVPITWSPSRGSNPLATNCTGISVVNATTLSSDMSLNVLITT